MTAEPAPRSGRRSRRLGARLGPLGHRLLAAFLLVALAAVAVLGVAALVATDRGLVATRQAERQQVAERAAELVAAAYLAAGGWAEADLAPARAVAEAAGGWLVVRSGDMTVWPGPGRGGPGGRPGEPGAGPAGASAGPAEPGAGPGDRAGEVIGPGADWPGAANRVTAPVLVAGEQVGTVWLGFPDGSPAGRTVAWAWIAGAAGLALLVAVAASWFVSRRLAGPLARVAGAARRFAAGDRAARSGAGRAAGELGEVARAFDAMADQVVATDAGRRQLAADVAHELRTPLAGLQAGLEELRDGLSQPDPARLAGLHDQALRLGRVVDDLAELSAAESAALSLRLAELDLAELVRTTVDAQLPGLRAAGLVVDTELPGPVPVRADADRIYQSVANLLANAARYCRPGDRVSVALSTQDATGLVTVADTGPGIPPDELPHVFRRLWRGRGSSVVAGSGIGLAVVRELVTAHGGTVTVDSTPGSGTRFTIRLPLLPGR